MRTTERARIDLNLVILMVKFKSCGTYQEWCKEYNKKYNENIKSNVIKLRLKYLSKNFDFIVEEKLFSNKMFYRINL